MRPTSEIQIEIKDFSKSKQTEINSLSDKIEETTIEEVEFNLKINNGGEIKFQLSTKQTDLKTDQVKGIKQKTKAAEPTHSGSIMVARFPKAVIKEQDRLRFVQILQYSDIVTIIGFVQEVTSKADQEKTKFLVTTLPPHLIPLIPTDSHSGPETRWAARP